jgi:hypothetical protein
MGLGVARADLVGLTGQTFDGALLVATDVLVVHTLYGDANLDRRVDFNDLARLAQNYNNADGQRTWPQGDFTYDGIVDFNDLAKMAQNYNTALPAGAIPGAAPGFEADWAAAIAAVPEPATAAFMGFAMICLIRRR